MQALLVAGNAVHDTLVRSIDRLEWGRTRWVDSIGQSLGGNGANTAYAAGMLGTPVRLLAYVGADAAGEDAVRRLEAAGVDTRWVARLDAPTPSTVSLINPEGARMLLHCPGASLHGYSEPPELPRELVDGCSHFHLANVYALPHLRRRGAEWMRRARQAGLATSLDTGWDVRGDWMRVLEPCLPCTDVLFVNEDEARMLSGESDPGAAARVFLERGARAVVVKLGAAGCAVHSRSVAVRVPAFRVDAVDTTGAGDCFAGGFLAGLMRGMNLEEAARLGNASGALSVSRLGSVAGLLPFDATIEWMRAAQVVS